MAKKAPAAVAPQGEALPQGSEQTEAAAAPAAVAPGAVAMVRDPQQYPSPHKADVHPAEVANYAAGGWTFA